MNVSMFEDELRKVEARLEELGREICNVPGGGRSFSSINKAIEDVQNAIHMAYLMRNN